MSYLEDNIQRLINQGKIEDKVILWGIGKQTDEVIDCLHEKRISILFIIDNFKSLFWHTYHNIVVADSRILGDGNYKDEIVLLAVNYSDSIRKQLNACGVYNVINLRNLDEQFCLPECGIEYFFEDRSSGEECLCYILAGYESELWESTIARIEKYQEKCVDICIVSSGKYDSQLELIAKRNKWSYLYTKVNQVCYIQNKVIELHPKAKYIIKMDEDMFVSQDFFSSMIDGMKDVENQGEYHVNFVVPTIPLNCAGYVSYLKGINCLSEYEKRFGRAYRSRFSAIFSVEEVAEYLWDTIDSFDNMAEFFSRKEGWNIVNCYFNIGCIMYTRQRWIMMGKWPENANESGMGTDEAYIYSDGLEKDLAIYELKNVLVGHLAFGHQKKRMMEYYRKNKEKF